MSEEKNVAFLRSPEKISRLYACPLFAGMQEEEVRYTLSLLAGEERQYSRGAFLHHAGEPLHRFGLVLSGCVGVYADDLDGNQVQMASVGPGETFGESLCYLRLAHAPVYILAVEDSDLLWLHTDAFRTIGETGDARIFPIYHRFVSMLAGRTLAMNDRIQILSKIRLRDKLLTFFAQYARHNGRDTFTIPFDRAGLALYLGTDRAALSRELSAMQKEGLIEFYRNSFRILRGSSTSCCKCNKTKEESGV